MAGFLDRERKVDVNKMTDEQADELSAQLGREIGRIMDEANLQCNKILNIYGLCTQITYQLRQMGETVEEKPKTESKPKKQAKKQSLSKKSKKQTKTSFSEEKL